MNIAKLNPYIRLAKKSTLRHPFQINNRVILDYELVYVREGKCNITIDGERHIFKKGDIFLLTPGTEHRFDSIEGYPFSQPHIHFDMFYDKFSESRYINYKQLSEMTDSEKQLIQENVFCCCPAHIPDSTIEIENNWSIFIYIAGDNNLEGAYLTELLYMQQAILPENVEVYVLMDRSEGYSTAQRDWTDTRVGKIRHSNGGAVAVEWMYFDEISRHYCP